MLAGWQRGGGEQWSLYLGGENVGCNERSELHQILKEARGAMRCAYCTLRYYGTTVLSPLTLLDLNHMYLNSF